MRSALSFTGPTVQSPTGRERCGPKAQAESRLVVAGRERSRPDPETSYVRRYSNGQLDLHNVITHAAQYRSAHGPCEKKGPQVLHMDALPLHGYRLYCTRTRTLNGMSPSRVNDASMHV